MNLKKTIWTLSEGGDFQYFCGEGDILYLKDPKFDGDFCTEECLKLTNPTFEVVKIRKIGDRQCLIDVKIECGHYMTFMEEGIFQIFMTKDQYRMRKIDQIFLD